MLSKNIKYLVGVDHLRGIAALLVILFHSTQIIGADIAHQSGFTFADYGYTQWNIFKSLISEGHFGVALFMTLSGFIFTYGLYGKKVDAKGFFRNRFIRIYPLYIFLIFLSIYLYPALQGDLLQNIFLTLLPFGNVGGGIVATGVLATGAMFWTIAVEVQFYLVFPFLIRYLNEHKFKILWGIIAVFITLRLLAFLAGDVNMSTFGYFSIFGRMDQFILGMLGAYFFITKKKYLRKNRYLKLAASTTAIVLLLFVINRLRHHFGYVPFENFYVILPAIEGLLSAALIITYVTIFQKKSRSIISWLFAKLGELSYSLYLTHFMIITLIVARIDLPNIFNSWWWSGLFFGVVLVLPLTIGFSILTYSFIEKPFLKLRKKYVIDKKTETAQQAI